MASDAVVCVRVIVLGQVQGVGFRAATLREAARLGGLKGFVRNLRDGTVELVVQGEAGKVSALVNWARRGPPAAHVDRVLEEPADVDPARREFDVA